MDLSRLNRSGFSLFSGATLISNQKVRIELVIPCIILKLSISLHAVYSTFFS